MPQLTPLSSLCPTQMTLGLREVEKRTAALAALSAKKLKEQMTERVVPCVKGPGGRLLVIDHHHFCRALLGIGEKAAMVDVVADTSHLHPDEHWCFMDLRCWVHPFDADGIRQPIPRLPARIADLVDDPYRTLAWYLRHEHGYVRENKPFEEFIWADFLRRRIPRPSGDADYEEAQAAALKLARSAAASHMPGWQKGK